MRYLSSRLLPLPVAAVLLLLVPGGATPSWEHVVFRGAADASTAVPAPGGNILVADDEDNVLRLYAPDEGGLPIATFPMNGHLGIAPDDPNPEADIEASTVDGDLVYWMASHGRNKNGRHRPNRHQFFATRFAVSGEGKVDVIPVGRAYGNLANRLCEDPRYIAIGLLESHGTPGSLTERERHLAPKDEGLNIEGLAASPEGGTLLVGFRNPRPMAGDPPRPHALIAPLENGREVLLGGAEPRFGDPILLDLDSLGLRSMEWIDEAGAYLLVAGEHRSSHRFALYRWDGEPAGEPELLRIHDDRGRLLTPESMLPGREPGTLYFLSDDGSLDIEVETGAACLEELDGKDRCPNKALADEEAKTFRGWAIPFGGGAGE